MKLGKKTIVLLGLPLGLGVAAGVVVLFVLKPFSTTATTVPDPAPGQHGVMLPLDTKVVNLSPGGAQLDLDAPLPPGDRIRIAFHTSGGQSPLNLDCEVLWWRSAAAGRVAHGLAFRNLTPDDDRHLAELFAPPV